MITGRSSEVVTQPGPVCSKTPYVGMVAVPGNNITGMEAGDVHFSFPHQSE